MTVTDSKNAALPTLPARQQRRISTQERAPRRIPIRHQHSIFLHQIRIRDHLLAMPMLKRDPKLCTIIHKLSPHNIVHRGAVLHPTHQRREQVIWTFERDAFRRRPAALAHDPGSGPRVTVKHARNPVEAEEVVELLRGRVHSTRKMFVEAFGVEAGDLIILAPVIDEYFAASIAVVGKAGRPCSDV